MKDIGNFYNGTLDRWKIILGPSMHYHAGFFSTLPPYSESAIEAAFSKAVSDLYEFIPRHCSLYDVGCGWGGPLAMLVRDQAVKGLGITPSKTQQQFAASRGLNILLGNAETTLPTESFDCSLLLESFTHIQQKELLLRNLACFSQKLIMRVNCQDQAPPSAAFGGSMQMISSSQLKEMIQNSGWQITHWTDRRMESLPSVEVWRKRLEQIEVCDDPHIETLRRWSNRVASYPEEWGRNNPLIEVVAVR